MSALQLVWFILIAVLFSGFFFLDGFDYGVGMAVKTLATNDEERTQVIQTIGPVWDGNEVWLITAGGGHVCLLPVLVRFPVLRLLPGALVHFGWPDYSGDFL